MTIESALTYFLAIFVFAVTPGPGIFALLAKGMSAGTRPCIPRALGMTVSGVIYRSHRAKPERYVSGGASSARRFFQSARAQKGTNRTAGSLMVAAGAFLVAKG